jgi:hypothetical protein
MLIKLVEVGVNLGFVWCYRSGYTYFAIKHSYVIAQKLVEDKNLPTGL